MQKREKHPFCHRQKIKQKKAVKKEKIATKKQHNKVKNHH